VCVKKTTKKDDIAEFLLVIFLIVFVFLGSPCDVLAHELQESLLLSDSEGTDCEYRSIELPKKDKPAPG